MLTDAHALLALLALALQPPDTPVTNTMNTTSTTTRRRRCRCTTRSFPSLLPDLTPPLGPRPLCVFNTPRPVRRPSAFVSGAPGESLTNSALLLTAMAGRAAAPQTLFNKAMRPTGRGGGTASRTWVEPRQRVAAASWLLAAYIRRVLANQATQEVAATTAVCLCASPSLLRHKQPACGGLGTMQAAWGLGPSCATSPWTQ